MPERGKDTGRGGHGDSLDASVREPERTCGICRVSATANSGASESEPRRSRSPGETQAGLTLREASLLSRRVSQFLNDEQYAIAQSTLSEYEAQNAPPRHLEKVITLCLIYGFPLIDFAAASGTAPEDLGRMCHSSGISANF
jgi:hypothetical protein